MLVLAASRALTGWDEWGESQTMESVDWWADEREGGEEGACCTKTSSGRYSTNAVTVLTTWDMATSGKTRSPGKRRGKTYLDEAVSRIPVVEICHSKLFAVLQLPYLHGEKSNSSFLVLFVGGIKLVWHSVDVYWSNWGWQKVEEVTQRDAKGETVPELCHGIGRLPGGTRRRCEGEVGGKVLNAHEAGTQRRTLLIEGGRLGSGLVEEGVVCDWEVDRGSDRGDD